MLTVRKLLLASAITVVASQAWAIDVTGTWLMSVQTPAGTGTPSLTFKQSGEILTGDYKGQAGEASLTGTIKGNDLMIKYTFSAQGTDIEITYSGTVDGTNTSGKVALLPAGGSTIEGTFTGKKQ
jgi:hypothetical protein